MYGILISGILFLIAAVAFFPRKSDVFAGLGLYAHIFRRAGLELKPATKIQKICQAILSAIFAFLGFLILAITVF